MTPERRTPPAAITGGVPPIRAGITHRQHTSRYGKVFDRWQCHRDCVHRCCERVEDRRPAPWVLAEHLRLASFAEAVALEILDITPAFDVLDWEVSA